MGGQAANCSASSNFFHLHLTRETKKFDDLLLDMKENMTGWWFQPIWKILVKMGIFPQIGVIFLFENHHLDEDRRSEQLDRR